MYDKEGTRTIGTVSYCSIDVGVLTKADSVDQERIDRWRGIISGEDKEHALAHGYYLTMQMRRDPTSTLKDTLVHEMEFFHSSPLWTPIALSPFGERIGINKLRKKLSYELSRLIEQRSTPCPPD
jgi:hypothetical protein